MSKSDELGARIEELSRRLEALEESLQADRQENAERLRRVEQASAYVLFKGGLRDELARLQTSIDAVVRRLFLDGHELEHPFWLTSQRFRLLSQNGEDGMTLALLGEAGILSSRFAEIGCGFNGGNSGFLVQELGWSGLMVDADANKVEATRLRFPSPRVTVAQAWVTRDGIDDLLSEHGLSGEIDFLSIDIDGNDYWVWEAMSACTPRLVAIEYNALFGAERAVVVPYAEDFVRGQQEPKGYFGASLAALERLGRKKGYRLVGVEPRGANAYFMRKGVAKSIPACHAREVYRPLLGARWEHEELLSPKRIRELADRTDALYAELEMRDLPLIDLAR